MIACDRCRTPIPVEVAVTGLRTQCGGCGVGHRLEVFPALLRPLPTAAKATPVVAGEEAGCFYHPDSQATVACDACGRFLCGLCDLAIGGDHICPRCLEAKAAGGVDQDLVAERTLWDRIALALAVYPLLIFYFTLFTAPAALFICWRYRKAPGSLVGGRRWRWSLAVVLSTLQILGWVALFGFLAVAIIEAA